MLTTDGYDVRMHALVRQGTQRPTEMEALLNDGRAWFRYPQLERAFHRGRTWIRSTDPGSISEPLPPAELGELVKESGEVKDLGTERIRGARTRHLRATIDLKRVARSLSPETRARFGLLLKADVIPFDVYIGPYERPLRYRLEARVAGDKDASAASAKWRMDVLRYDVEAKFDPPPASEVFTERELRNLARP